MEKQLKRTLGTELATQRIPKVYPKQQKEIPKVSKIMPGDHLRGQRQVRVARDQKKSNFSIWVHPRSCQKCSKFDLLETPRQLKMKLLNQAPKNKEVGYSLKAQERAFEIQNGQPWDTCRRTESSERTPSIFEGCTVRFACFCNTRPLLFAPRNTPKEDFLTYLTDSWSNTRKKDSGTL